MTPRRAIALAILTIPLLLVLVLLRREPQGQQRHEDKKTPATARTPSSTVRKFSSQGSTGSRNPAPPLRRSTTAAMDLPTTRIQQEGISGWLLDDFRTWYGIPSGYTVSNVILEPGGITVGTARTNGSMRVGTVESPPLGLNKPVQAMAVTPRKELAPGTTVRVEVSFSGTGTEWTSWNTIERTAEKSELFGNKTAAGKQDSAESQSSGQRGNSSDGPFVKYRLVMTCDDTTGPLLHDVRIWHTEPLEMLANSTSLDSAPLHAISPDPEETMETPQTEVTPQPTPADLEEATSASALDE